jgi:oligoendopeptidase F
MAAVSLPMRDEISVEDTWDLECMFQSDDEWRAAVDLLTDRLSDVSAYQGRLAEKPAMLAEALDAIQQISLDVSRIGMYAFLSYSVDTNDQDAGARTGRATSLSSQVRATLAFVEPELMDVGFDVLSDWMEREPRLAAYRHYFDRLERRQAHVRSAEVEELLGSVRDPFTTASETHSILTNADLKFAPARTADGAESFDVAQSTIGSLVNHADRNVRRTAWENYADAHLADKNTMANCLVAGVKQDVFFARARHCDSSLEASLSPEGIPVAVFHNLIDTYKKNLPTWHRYWRVRRKALGYDKLYEYDIKAPLADQAPKVPYEQAVAWIAEGMQPLGEKYVETLRRGATRERWVDIYPNQGKRAGAFSWGVPDGHPYIMMSYTDDLMSLSTLAHELGHSMHSCFAWERQPLVYADYSLFVAEVASNFNQALVRAHLFETHPDRDFQIGLIEEAMSNFHRYFFIMPTLARFELELHERIERGSSLSADDMIALMADLFAEGYNGEVEMERERTGITWAQFSSHLYAYFYVYQYATGISGAHALAGKVLAGEEGATECYLEFLYSGGSKYPLDALLDAGVDLASPEPVEETFAVLAGLVDRLEALVG